jgi:hypothetical protein
VVDRDLGSVARLRATGVMASALLALGATLFASGLPGHVREAEALAITQSVTQTGDFTQDATYTDRTYATSTTATPVAPGGPVADSIGATLTFTSRYSALFAADRDATGNVTSTTGTLSAKYQVNFSITAAAGFQYIVQVDTRMLGELTAVNDGGKASTGTIGNVTGTYTGAGTTSGSLNLTLNLNNTTDTGADVSFSPTGVFTITGLVGTGAAQNFVLDFTWTMSASSTTNGANIGDEAAVRLGQTALTTLTGTTAGDYPGAGGDVPSRVSCDGSTDLSTCDGHTVMVTVTEIPAPPTMSLVALGFAAVSGFSWRRWRRR